MLERALRRVHLPALGSTIGLLLVLQMGAKMTNFLKDVVLAQRFGVDARMDAVTLAVTIIAFVSAMVGPPMAYAIIPTLSSLQSAEARRRIVAHALGAALILLISAALLLGIVPQWLIQVAAPNAPGSTQTLAETLLSIMAVTVVFSGVTQVLTGVLQAESKFAGAGILAALRPLLIVLCIVAFPFLGVISVAWGTLIGAALELVGIVILTYRRGIQIGVGLPWHEPLIKPMASQYMAVVFSSAIMYSTELIDFAMASSLTSGAVALLAYANKIPGVITAAMVSAVGTAILPSLSALAAKGRWDELEETRKRYVKLAFGGGLAIAIGLCSVSPWLISWVFERGAFTHAHAREVSVLQAMLALQLPFYLPNTVNARVIIAMGDSGVFRLAAVLNFAVNIALNYALMRIWGVIGIAVSTVGVYAINHIYITYVVHQRLRKKRALTMS